MSSLPGVAEDRTIPRTSWPLDVRNGSNADPMNPDDPVTSIFMTSAAREKGWEFVLPDIFYAVLRSKASGKECALTWGTQIPKMATASEDNS